MHVSLTLFFIIHVLRLFMVLVFVVVINDSISLRWKSNIRTYLKTLIDLYFPTLYDNKSCSNHLSKALVMKIEIIILENLHS